MGKVTQFLLRWLFLSNLIDDRLEIQNLPHLPPPSSPSYYNNEQQQPYHHQQQQQQQQHQQNYPQQYQSQLLPSITKTTSSTSISTSYHLSKEQLIEQEWKQNCIRSISMYPPGVPRLLALDSIRLQIVYDLSREFRKADKTLRNHFYVQQQQHQQKQTSSKALKQQQQDENDETTTLDLANPNLTNESNDESLSSSSVDLDADLEMIKALRQATKLMIEDDYDKDDENNEIAQNNKINNINNDNNSAMNDNEEILEAQKFLSEAREYLPQLISTILHSQNAMPSNSSPIPPIDPLEAMRKLLILRCLANPSIGIEVCWLLEAEVGRAWKTLFEHRQQTGRRLIIVLPAEKARVIANIGIEKRAAFDLLQDVEQATAYGSTGATTTSFPHPENMGGNLNLPPKLPAALSFKRCSHFGDTMHFVDSLTKISLDLRMEPVLHRSTALYQKLEEVNRRLRRRMVTRGAVSLDVEDNLTHEDWPQINDISLDLLRYSVHFPLERNKSFHWAGGKDSPSTIHGHGHGRRRRSPGAMRVLNIVSSECRVLASRERCPFLIQLEIAETGLDGGDARLYGAGGVDTAPSSLSASSTTAQQQSASKYGFGVSLEEVIRLFGSSNNSNNNKGEESRFVNNGVPPDVSYHIPAELLAGNDDLQAFLDDDDDDDDDKNNNNNNDDDDDGTDSIESTSTSQDSTSLPRGGWQEPHEGYYQDYSTMGYNYMNPYEIMRQQELNNLHEQMLSERLQQQQQSSNANYNFQNVPQVLTGNQLLDHVFGPVWESKCEQIRQNSPYGNIKGWRLASFIMKAGEDIRREALVMQVISKLRDWFEEEIPANLQPYLTPYTIMCVGGDAGMLECLSDTKSIDEVKKLTDGFTSLRDYFERAYGPPKAPQQQQQQQQPQQQVSSTGQPLPPPPPPPQPQPQTPIDPNNITFEEAQDNFLRSLVGYSLVCYILQIKDRHNANILLNRKGHIVHIDFGFVLGDTPKMGKVPLFSERAPFKLTAEFWDVIGGWNLNAGGHGVKFCKMFEAAFESASRHSEEIASLIEAAILNLTSNSKRARELADGVRARLRMRGKKGSPEQKMFVMDLVNAALTSWGTSTYDWLQKSMNGYQ